MALPSQIDPTTPAGSASPATIDDQIRALKDAACSILGIPAATNISVKGFTFVAGGLQVILFQDTAGSPATEGYLQYNADHLEVHDGTAARELYQQSGTDVAVADGGTGASTAANARTNLGLAIGTDVFQQRTITGTANQITVTNGDGVSGNPTLATPQDIATSSSPTFAGMSVTGTTTLATVTVSGPGGGITMNGVPLTMGTGNPAILPAAVSGTPAQHGLYRENTPKGWVKATFSGGIEDSFNVASITDDGTGLVTVTWDRDFASAHYCVTLTASTTVGLCFSVYNQAAGSVQGRIYDAAGNLADVGYCYVLAIGDQ